MLAVFMTAALTAVNLTDGEICRFAAAGTDDPFQRWLSSQKVACVAAGPPVEIPPGLWNVFARSNGRVSAPLLVAGEHAPASIAFTFEESATVAPLLRDGQQAVVYLPRRGTAYPVVAGQAIVPANEPLWLITLDRSRPVGLLPLGILEPRSHRDVDASGSSPPALLGWLQVPESDRAVLAKTEGLRAPVVSAGSGEGLKVSDPLPPFDAMHGAFFRIGGLPEGQTRMQIGGRGWLAEQRPIEIAPGLTAATAPLTVRAAATLAVHWSSDRDLEVLDRSIGSCDPPDGSPAEIVVSKCPRPRRGDRDELADCAPVHRQTFDVREDYGAFTLENVEPGLYRATFRYGTLPPITGATAVAALEHRDIRLRVFYRGLYGSLTYGGEPLTEAATIVFPGGHGFAPDGSGEYRAVLLRSLQTDAILKVSACDGAPAAAVALDAPLRLEARFDIDIPANELTVIVRDTFTRELLRGATVRLQVMSMRMPFRPIFAQSALADENGRVVHKSLFPGRVIRISVSHAGYETHEVPTFSLSRNEKRTVEVELLPLRGDRGRIVSDMMFESGAIFWFSPSGVETERAEVAPDGTFVYAGSHGPEETMAVVSVSHPLWVAPARAVERHQTITLAFPKAPVRTFDVAVSGAAADDRRHVGIAIGGVRVPLTALLHHQFLRGEASFIRGDRPFRVRDVAETGRIEVLLGPRLDEVPRRLVGADIFALPDYATTPRLPLLPGPSAVVFPAP